MPSTQAIPIRNLQAARETTNTFKVPTNLCQGLTTFQAQETNSLRWVESFKEKFAFLGTVNTFRRGVKQ